MITRKYYYREEKGSEFGQGKHRYDLNKIFAKVEHDKHDIQSVPVKSLLWGIRPSELEAARVRRANPDVPIIVEHYRGRLVVVDGAHRVVRAKQLGRKNIGVRFVTQKELTASEAKGTRNTTDRSSDPGVMIALHLPMAVARKVNLSAPGAESPSSLHVTLAYLGRLSKLGEGVSAQQAVIQRTKNILAAVGGISKTLNGSITGVGRFTGSESSDGKDVIYAGVDVPGLVELRHRICQSLKAFGIPYSQDHGFTPHVTLAYVEPKADSPIARIPSHPVSFGSVALTIGDDRQSFPLVGRTEYERTQGMTAIESMRLRVMYCRGDVACAACSAPKRIRRNKYRLRRGTDGRIRILYGGGSPCGRGHAES